MFHITDEIHWTRPDGRVETVQLWHEIGGPRVQVASAVDGERVYFESTSWSVERATEMMAAAHAKHDAHALTDEQARASITARVGIIPDSCAREDCGARVPIGSPKCEDGHLLSRHAGSGLACWRDAIVLPAGGPR